MVDASAVVASSLGNAVVILLEPAVRLGVQATAGSSVPQIIIFINLPSIDSTVETKTQDYDLNDLPPFELDGILSTDSDR